MSITDTERINYLQQLNDRKNYTGMCVLRESETGRGWRLHETSRRGFESVRNAIDEGIRLQKESNQQP